MSQTSCDHQPPHSSGSACETRAQLDRTTTEITEKEQAIHAPQFEYIGFTFILFFFPLHSNVYQQSFYIVGGSGLRQTPM